MFLAMWLLSGIVFFFLARGAWGLEFGCTPIRVKTIAGMIVCMWLPPLCALAAATWFAQWLIENTGNKEPGRFRQFWQKELVNPCRLFARRSH